MPLERRVKRPGRFNKPHYLFNPRTVARRSREPGQTELPWGLPLFYAPNGVMGAAIDRTGVYDLGITEALFRLLKPGDTAVDVGANVGYMSSIMACRVGTQGRVMAFEPQPDVFSRLEQNVACWQACPRPTGHVEAHQIALSSRAAPGTLNVPEENDDNHVRASLRSFDAKHVRSVPVQIRRLDDVVDPSVRIAVLKVDAERHELEVLRGAERSLQTTMTVVIEEHQELPTPVTQLLVEHGFTIHTVNERLVGPQLMPVEACSPHVGWGPPNVVATRDSAALRSAFKRLGWSSLRGRRS
jgi:FkbM family methyltransferase